MKFSKIRCDSGMKLPLIPHEYLFWTVNPMCHVNPTQAMRAEKEAMRSLLMTMISIAWGTDSPMATVDQQDSLTNGPYNELR